MNPALILIMVLLGVHPPQTQVRNDTALHMDVVENFDGCGERKPNGWFHQMDECLVEREKPSAARPRACGRGVRLY